SDNIDRIRKSLRPRYANRRFRRNGNEGERPNAVCQTLKIPSGFPDRDAIFFNCAFTYRPEGGSWAAAKDPIVDAQYFPCLFVPSIEIDGMLGGSRTKSFNQIWLSHQTFESDAEVTDDLISVAERHFDATIFLNQCCRRPVVDNNTGQS